jgi:hypothetical protein
MSSSLHSRTGFAARLARERPRLPIDNDDARAVANWVSHEHVASLLAEVRAVPFLHTYLDRAEQVGIRAGWRMCLLFWWPLALAVAVAGFVFSATG